ncbi:MAG TPA: helix-turn-helix transcriptional regulator [Thermoanaerobaculia bacterium]
MFSLVGETLRRLRKERGLTLEQLGEEAGLGRGQLSRIENSHQEATFATLEKILSSQGVTRREFFRRYDMVEREARAFANPEEGLGSMKEVWPDEVQEILDKVESFVSMTFLQPHPVAQGAIEMGNVVVLFRVIAKKPARPDSPGEEGEEAGGEPKPRPARKAPARKKKS